MSTMTREQLLKQIFAMEPSLPRVTTPIDVYVATERWARKRVEYFLVLVLNGAHQITSVEVVSQGLVNRSLVHAREVFRPAIVKGASAVILAHNHPSGNLAPSQEDLDVTRRLVEAGTVIGIEVLDHLVISRRGYYSFKEHGGL